MALTGFVLLLPMLVGDAKPRPEAAAVTYLPLSDGLTDVCATWTGDGLFETSLLHILRTNDPLPMVAVVPTCSDLCCFSFIRLGAV